MARSRPGNIRPVQQIRRGLQRAESPGQRDLPADLPDAHPGPHGQNGCFTRGRSVGIADDHAVGTCLCLTHCVHCQRRGCLAGRSDGRLAWIFVEGFSGSEVAKGLE